MSQNPWEQQNQQNFPAQGEHPANQNYPQGDYLYSQQNQGAFYGQPQPEHPAPKRKGTGALVLTTAVIAALVGGGVGAGVTALADQNPAPSSTVSGTTIVNNTDSVNEITAAAEKATPSVVTIGVNGSAASGSGSGIILDSDGHILTNTHVVTMDGQTNNASIEVQMSDGTVRQADVVGTDPTSDLAVIKMDTAGLNITPATLGDSSKLNVGDVSVAIGAPLGLQNTVTDGIISSLSRTIEVASSEVPNDSEQSDNSLGSQDSPFEFQMPDQQGQSPSGTRNTVSLNVIQTDAAVNPGNSGGALVNSKGEVIGVNVAIASAGSSGASSEAGNIGLGFAIPINYAQRIAQDLIDNGEASHGLLGATVSTSPANDDQSQTFGDGALIQEISNGGAADEAGIRRGDVITEFNGKKIAEAGQLTAAVRETEPGTEVTVKLNRNGSMEEKQVTIGDSANSSN